MTLPAPALGTRGTAGYRFAELFLALGPQEIGATGQNRFEDLFGRVWALVLTRERRLELYQRAEDAATWAPVTELLPPLFGQIQPEARRRFSLAFDQSARVIVAYEDTADGFIRVTRWTGSEYVQNVTISGVDPCLIMDATLADPRGYPRAADGWSVYEAFLAGIPVLFEWLAGDPVVWLANATPDSDVLLFYLTTDRLGVRARVQRQLYATAQTVHDFDAPVVMDRVIALSGRYQALVSDVGGEPLADMLLSDPYLGNFVISPESATTLPSALTPDTIRLEQEVYNTVGEDSFVQGLGLEAVVIVGATAFLVDGEAFNQALALEAVKVVGEVGEVSRTDAEALDQTLAPESRVHVFRVAVPTEESNSVDFTLAPETIRVQTV